jgi:hypothetical protein
VDKRILKVLSRFKAHLENHIQPWASPAFLHGRILS